LEEGGEEMREILFRGKDVETNEWVYGSLINHCFDNFEIINGCSYTEARWEVEPKTVGRYINAFDANGKEICEGDILRDTDGCGIYEFMCFLVEEGEGEYILRINEKEMLDEYFSWNEFEVIGNIHDNPELLEEDKND